MPTVWMLRGGLGWWTWWWHGCTLWWTSCGLRLRRARLRSLRMWRTGTTGCIWRTWPTCGRTRWSWAAPWPRRWRPRPWLGDAVWPGVRARLPTYLGLGSGHDGLPVTARRSCAVPVGGIRSPTVVAHHHGYLTDHDREPDVGRVSGYGCPPTTAGQARAVLGRVSHRPIMAAGRPHRGPTTPRADHIAGRPHRGPGTLRIGHGASRPCRGPATSQTCCGRPPPRLPNRLLSRG